MQQPGQASTALLQSALHTGQTEVACRLQQQTSLTAYPI